MHYFVCLKCVPNRTFRHADQFLFHMRTAHQGIPPAAAKADLVTYNPGTVNFALHAAIEQKKRGLYGEIPQKMGEELSEVERRIASFTARRPGEMRR